MPKLSTQAIHDRKTHIEAAAKELFIKQGFHATSTRDIAAQANVSLGNLYNYYETKEEILASIIGKYQQVVDARLEAIFNEIEEPLHPSSLEKFGYMVRDLVNDHADYWLLMYIDVLEFKNQHFRKMFEGLAGKLRRRFKKNFAALQERGELYADLDPATCFTTAYMQFFNYFLVERLFGGNHHLGMNDQQVIHHLTQLFCRGAMKPNFAARALTNLTEAAGKTRRK